MAAVGVGVCCRGGGGGCPFIDCGEELCKQAGLGRRRQRCGCLQVGLLVGPGATLIDGQAILSCSYGELLPGSREREPQGGREGGKEGRRGGTVSRL